MCSALPAVEGLADPGLWTRGGPGKGAVRMPINDVYVVQGVSGNWVVSNRKRTLACYQSQHGAMAFARALAYSRHVAVVVQPQDGSSTRHVGASFTYPRDL